jgi:hypothetical protein
MERKRLSKLLVSGFETFGVLGPPSSPLLRSHGLSVDGVLCICSGMYKKKSKNRATINVHRVLLSMDLDQLQGDVLRRLLPLSILCRLIRLPLPVRAHSAVPPVAA